MPQEKRKWQTEIENKKRQLEDDRRALQHLKSKALRERWLLEGAAPGPEQDERRKQLQLDEDKTRSLEENICRLEEELLGLENGGVCETITHTTVSSGSVKDVEVKVHSVPKQDEDQIIQEVKVHKSPRMNKPREETEEMKRAMYSVEIKVERDKVTGETRVLSLTPHFPVDLSHHGVKVYEDERKVVHEMNGDDGVQLLSFSQVEELIFKADEASVVSHTGDTVTSPPHLGGPGGRGGGEKGGERGGERGGGCPVASGDPGGGGTIDRRVNPPSAAELHLQVSPRLVHVLLYLCDVMMTSPTCSSKQLFDKE
ncbi:hypothetical protein KUCAC02_036430 [Chaenocephalus aceratus]|nr:hypothetical protein KUCAC02_036430 [Chaenocephalus aceratus]